MRQTRGGCHEPFALGHEADREEAGKHERIGRRFGNRRGHAHVVVERLPDHARIPSELDGHVTCGRRVRVAPARTGTAEVLECSFGTVEGEEGERVRRTEREGRSLDHAQPKARVAGRGERGKGIGPVSVVRAARLSLGQGHLAEQHAEACHDSVKERFERLHGTSLSRNIPWHHALDGKYSTVIIEKGNTP